MSLILGIESSCDETAAALVTSERRLLSHKLATQEAAHRPYGGVVPEIAARAHVEILPSLIEDALAEANVTLAEVDAIAATAGPGLVGGVMVGLLTAKGLALAADKPLIAVNHLEGHALSPMLAQPELRFPYLLLLVSGGHCQLLAVEGLGRYRRLATTIDDAAGEAFDKTAKLLGLGYPGGPIVDRRAAEGNERAYEFPTVRITHADRRTPHDPARLDFSFSGLKTAVLRVVRAHEERHENLTDRMVSDICASFQRVVVETLLDRTFAAARQHGAASVGIAGGVSANSRLRSEAVRRGRDAGLPVFIPSLALSTDNAAMIAAAGLRAFGAGVRAGLDLNAEASLRL